MVTEQARWVLRNTKVDPLKVAKAWKIEENECWEYLEDLNLELNNLAKDRKDKRKEARVWAESLKEAYDTKRLLLIERIKNAKTEKEKQERFKHFQVFTGKIKTLPPEQIERARNYPLKDLLETNKNIARCPFHDDRTASLNIKNNYYHCHACQITGDTIDFLMKRDGLTFQEAVIKLT